MRKKNTEACKTAVDVCNLSDHNFVKTIVLSRKSDSWSYRKWNCCW